MAMVTAAMAIYTIGEAGVPFTPIDFTRRK
jgi:hypothetical protein